MDKHFFKRALQAEFCDKVGLLLQLMAYRIRCRVLSFEGDVSTALESVYM